MSRSFLSRWPFLAAVALVSAAASDVAVEAIANSGAFGARYYDRNDSSIVPSLIVATLLAVWVIAVHVRALVAGRSRGAQRDWLIDAAQNVARRMPLRDFPAILGLQFAALFAMENAERMFAGTSPADGLTWLGGPAPISIAIHVTIAGIGMLAAGRLMRRCAAHVVSLVCHALDFVWCARNRTSAAAFVLQRDAAELHHDPSAHSRHIRGRAPPLFSAPV